jgi:hypothetical protein
MGSMPALPARAFSLSFAPWRAPPARTIAIVVAAAVVAGRTTGRVAPTGVAAVQCSHALGQIIQLAEEGVAHRRQAPDNPDDQERDQQDPLERQHSPAEAVSGCFSTCTIHGSFPLERDVHYGRVDV